MLLTAQAVKRAGAQCLRGGAYKPRTSPYSFQGLGMEGLEILRDVAQRLQMPAVTEVVEVADVAAVERYASAFQVGARNMQNFRLLKALGQSRKPVILKRGMAATVDDLLLAAEYILSEGNPNVILCERGIRTFETATRNTLDLNSIPHIKQHSHLPVIVDPSHGTGVRVVRDGHGQGGRGLRRGRVTRRSPPQSDGGPLRRPPIARSEGVRAAHAEHPSVREAGRQADVIRERSGQQPIQHKHFTAKLAKTAKRARICGSGLGPRMEIVRLARTG